jgi:hypothetical protein
MWFARIDVSEERIAFIIWARRMSEEGTALGVTGKFNSEIFRNFFRAVPPVLALLKYAVHITQRNKPVLRVL